MYLQHIDTVVIGAGQAGLAVSWHLSQACREHVVLERGRVADRWRTAGWDSLRLLTPNWMSRLPGWSYRGDDPDGYLPVAGLVDYLQDYADSFSAPVLTGTAVASVRQDGGRYRIDTDAGCWSARHVVLATGACGTPYLPPAARSLSAEIHQLTPASYRNPAQLAGGGVLVVGGSASGVQIAQELGRSGRRVVLSAGQHTRIPRTYRGMDIYWWLEQLGRLDRSIDDVRDPRRSRAEPSLQLVGRPYEDLDFGVLAHEGVAVAGRLVAADGRCVAFADDLDRTTAMADAQLRRLLDAIDSHVARHGLQTEVLPIPAYRSFCLPAGPRQLDLAAAGIGTVIWATGYRPSYPWLQIPVQDGAGEIRQQRGRTCAPGLYAVGLRFGQRRSSGSVDGARHDAATVADHLLGVRAYPTRAQREPATPVGPIRCAS